LHKLPAVTPSITATESEGIRVRGLVKRFGSVVALDGLDLDVGRGEIVALLGPNGAGKSTLLRILGTTVLPDAGRAEIQGADVVEDPVTARRAIGLMVGDERGLYWRLTGRENLEFFAALHGLDRSSAVRRADVLLGEAGLDAAADRPVSGYSSGMRVRLMLARALAAEPPLLLLDEPTRTLDPQAAQGFRALAGRLATDRRTGILFATHDLHEAVSVADRILVLSGGRAVLEEAAGMTDAARLEQAFLEAVATHAPSRDQEEVRW
jgi:ABC-2 type transport system ATP-binding protein